MIQKLYLNTGMNNATSAVILYVELEVQSILNLPVYYFFKLSFTLWYCIPSPFSLPVYFCVYLRSSCCIPLF